MMSLLGTKSVFLNCRKLEMSQKGVWLQLYVPLAYQLSAAKWAH